MFCVSNFLIFFFKKKKKNLVAVFDEVAADLDDPVVFLLFLRQVTAPGIIFVRLLCAVVYIFGCC